MVAQLSYLLPAASFHKSTAVLKPKTAERDRTSAAWRSSKLYALVWETHDFASPLHNGFAFSRDCESNLYRQEWD
jgi:hypothetical protein